jgi:hypothetical protein
LRDGDGLKSTVIYIRRDGQTAEATHDEIQSIINKRIETRDSTSNEINLKRHLEQLRALYGEIPRRLAPAFATGTLAAFLGTEPNVNGETYEEFVNRMIDLKKAIIARAIGEPVDAGDNQHVPFSQEIEHGAQLRAVRRAGA